MMPKMVNICDVCSEIFAGGDAPKNNMSIEKTDKYNIPIYANGEANDGLYGFTNFARVFEPSITISARGTIGYTSVRNTPFVPIVRLITLVPKKDIIDIRYLFYAAQNYKFDGSGTSIPQLTVPALKKYNFPLPEIEEQKQIVGMLDKICDLIDLRKQQLSKLDKLVKARFVEMFGNVGTNEKGWGFSKLGEVCEINPKKTNETKLQPGLVVSFIPMPAVSEKGEIDASETRDYEEVKKGFTYFKEDDVLFAKITPCMENGKGAVAKGLRNGIGFGSTEFHVLRPIEYISNPYWLYATTSFKQFRVDAECNMTGSAGQKRVPASFLESYMVSVPPIELQNEFAAFVKQIDKSKFEVQQSLEKLETLKKSLMQQYFG